MSPQLPGVLPLRAEEKDVATALEAAAVQTLVLREGAPCEGVLQGAARTKARVENAWCSSSEALRLGALDQRREPVRQAALLHAKEPVARGAEERQVRAGEVDGHGCLSAASRTANAPTGSGKDANNCALAMRSGVPVCGNFYTRGVIVSPRTRANGLAEPAKGPTALLISEAAIISRA